MNRPAPSGATALKTTCYFGEHPRGNEPDLEGPHLSRYLAEFGFRYNHRSGLGIEDTERTNELLRNVAGKRLTYRRPSEGAHA